jgi:type III secretory pathway component EscV
MVIVPVILAVLLSVGIGVAAYNAGQRNGEQNATEQIQSAQANGQEIQVVHVVDDNHGFFPGFFLFPFLLIGVLFLIGGMFRTARWGGKGHHGHGPGPWNDEGRQRFEDRAREWHQREHGGGDTPPAPTTAA